MSLITTLKHDSLVARKARDAQAASILTTLLGEAQMPGKNDGNRDSTDEEVAAVIKKFLKGVNETLVLRAGDARLLREKAILEAYLPATLDDAALRSAIGVVIEESGIVSPTARDMGALMKALQARYPGQIDGKAASVVLREVLAG